MKHTRPYRLSHVKKQAPDRLSPGMCYNGLPTACAIPPPHKPPSPSRRFRFFFTREMADQPRTVSFQTLFESALLRYEKKTGVTLSKHPLAAQLRDCNSVESFNKLLQDIAREVRESKRITKSIKNIVSILTPISSVVYPAGAVGLVR